MSRLKNNTRNYLSAAVVAVSLLLVMDAFISVANPSKEHLFEFDKCDILNVVHSYKNDAQTADVALLGSSLVEVPSIQAAALAVGQPVDRLTHHRCEFAEKALHSQLGTEVKVVSLAIGGEMASDAYLIAKHILSGEKTPRAIVYGIGPRDFQDNLMPGVHTSDTFKLLSDLDDLPDALTVREISFETKIGLALEHVSGIWRNRNHLCSSLTKSVNANVTSALPVMAGASTQNPVKQADLTKFIGGLIAPGEAVWHPDDEYMLRNYLARYNPTAPAQIETQLDYFKRLLQLCNERQIPIVVVNMPLGAINRKVMPPGFYDQYQIATKKICDEASVSYVNLNVSPLNRPENFLDTVHLNPSGSAEFFNALARAVEPTAIADSLKKDHPAIADRPSETY